jgi:PAS domain S-box-containing protein
VSLRFRINLLITVLTALFTLAVFKIVIDDTRRSVREEMEGANRVTLQLLSTVINEARMLSRDGQVDAVLLSFLRDLGRVRAHEIRLFDRDDRLVYTSPPSVYKVGRDAPRWFEALVQPELPVINLPVEGGHLTLAVDASRSIVDAWDDLKSLMLLILVFLVAVNLLVFFLIGRSLRPVSRILEGLQRMERGEFHARLPGFSLPEFDAISHTFNAMADALDQSHAENRRLALIAEQTGDAILIHDLEGRISYWNPAAERLFGWTAEEIVGQSASRLVPEARAAELARHSEVIRARGHIDHAETQRLTRDGRQIEVALSAAPLIDPATDQVIGEICSLRDITEVKRARVAEAALAENRRLTQLIQGRLEEERRVIARELHDELGQGVTAIRTIGTVIARKTETVDPEVHRSAQTIVAVAGQIYDTLHGMIRQLRPSALDHLGLRDTLEEAVQNWRNLHPEIGCTLQLEGDLEGLGEQVNITVYRIVQECLTNVVKHAHATHVDVSVIRWSGGGDRVEVTVRDNGRGLADPAAAEGRRFGLMGMRERAEALGGRFSLEPGTPAGLVVRAVLPLRDVPAVPRGATAAAPEATER